MNKQQSKEILHNYWFDIPIVRYFESSLIKKVLNQEIRSFIINYLREGEFSFEIGKQRHAFNTREIHQAYITKNPESKLTVYNFHFHIKKLLEYEFIFEVTSFLEGRHWVSYYGRTCKLAFFDDHTVFIDEERESMSESLIAICYELNPNIAKEKIKEIVNKIFTSLEGLYDKIIIRWMEEHYEILYTKKVDIMTFSTFLGSLLILKPDVSQHYKELFELMKLELN